MADQRDSHGTSEAQLRASIERRRVRMADTIEEIGERLNPDHLKQEFRAGVREQIEQTKHDVRSATIGRAETMINNLEGTVNRTSRTLMDTIRDNPVPAAMAGIGLGWLVLDARRHSDHDQHTEGRERGWGGVASTAPGYLGPYGHTAPPMDFPRNPGYTAGASDYGHRGEGAYDRARDSASERVQDVRHAADRVRDSVSGAAAETANQARDVADRVQETVSDAADRAQDAASDLAHRTQHAAESAWHEAEHRVRQGRYQARRVTEESPLAAGAVALALGFAAGMLIPETRREHRMMGPTRDRLLDEVQSTARRTADKVGRVVETAVEEGREAGEREARNQGLTSDETPSSATF
jgi:gas vesicle protein